MTDGDKIDPGTGYRLIDKAVDKPQKGDEYFSILWGANNWFPRNYSTKWLDNYEYRRKIDAGDGYRLVDPAVDKPESGDEVYHPLTGQFVPRCEWKGKEFGAGFTYRRKVEQTPKITFRFNSHDFDIFGPVFIGNPNIAPAPPAPQTVHVYAEATLDDWMDMDDPHDGVDTVGPVRRLQEIGKIVGGRLFVLYDEE